MRGAGGRRRRWHDQHRCLGCRSSGGFRWAFCRSALSTISPRIWASLSIWRRRRKSCSRGSSARWTSGEVNGRIFPEQLQSRRLSRHRAVARAVPGELARQMDRRAVGRPGGHAPQIPSWRCGSSRRERRSSGARRFVFMGNNEYQMVGHPCGRARVAGPRPAGALRAERRAARPVCCGLRWQVVLKGAERGQRGRSDHGGGGDGRDQAAAGAGGRRWRSVHPGVAARIPDQAGSTAGSCAGGCFGLLSAPSR